MLLAIYTFSYKYITGELKLHTGKFYLTDIFILALTQFWLKRFIAKVYKKCSDLCCRKETAIW